MKFTAALRPQNLPTEFAQTHKIKGGKPYPKGPPVLEVEQRKDQQSGKY